MIHLIARLTMVMVTIILMIFVSSNDAFTSIVAVVGIMPHQTTTPPPTQQSSTLLLRYYRNVDSSIRYHQQEFNPLYLRRKGDDDDEFDDNDDEEEEEEDDDEPPEIGDVETFRLQAKGQPSQTTATTPIISFGYNKGRSSPTTRKAIGKSSSSMASIYLCTHCGSEYVQWMGRCPTCKEWNTIQQHAVSRSSTSSSSSNPLRPIFGSTNKFTTTEQRPIGSWLDDISYHGGNTIGGSNINHNNAPIRITDLTMSSSSSSGDSSDSYDNNQIRRRIVVPDDDEFNTVLGGGIMKGSLILLGGDPGVGKSTLALQIAGTIATQLSQPTMKIGMGIPQQQQQQQFNTTTSHPLLPNVGPVWYVSGEENPDQIASRAVRLGIGTHRDNPSELFLLRQTHVDTLCEQVVAHHMQQPPPPSSLSPHNNRFRWSSDKGDDDDDDDDVLASPDLPVSNLPISLLIIDSIQTMVCDAGGTSHAGGITQVRECVAMFLRLAKSINIPILLIGHVTKSGEVAGPRTVEHMVDCVLYLDGMNEGSSGMTNLRMLRASKNRFGSSDEVGVYEMTRGRLLPVSDPSSLFLAHRNDQDDVEGCAIAIALEGMRAMTVEVQALVTMAAGEGNYGGRRTVNGISHSRLLLLLGVLQKRCHMFWSKQDVYINVVGRIRLDRGEGNAADLAIAVALASSRHCIPIRADTAFIGEIGLLGELRTVPAIEKRLQEARRMGFSRVITPRDYRAKGNRKKNSQQSTSVTQVNGIEWIQCTLLSSAINEGLVHPIPKRTPRPRSKPSSDNNSANVGTSTNDFMIEILDSDDDEEDSFL